jgi:hypothetical protein
MSASRKAGVVSKVGVADDIPLCATYIRQSKSVNGSNPAKRI